MIKKEKAIHGRILRKTFVHQQPRNIILNLEQYVALVLFCRNLIEIMMFT